MSAITIIKCDAQGREALRYSGEAVARGATWICVRAPFTFSDRDLGYIHLRRGDLFIEWFYADRWYNIFRVEDGASGQLKGWYCNLTRPARIEDDVVCADDLALDFFVGPDFTALLLDEEEYAALDLAAEERASVAAALDELRALVSERRGPFAPD